MNELKKHALALSVIAILIYFKFIIVPMVDWQDEKLLKLALLERKITKVEQLLINKNSVQELQNSLGEYLTTLNHSFYPAQPIEAFKLQQQKRIEEELTNFGLNINSIGWKNNQTLNEAPLIQFRVDIAFGGKSEQVIEFLLSLSNHVLISEIVGLNLSFQRQRIGQLGSLRARITVVYYMQTGT